MVLDGKSSQEHLVNVGIHYGSNLGPSLFLLYINDLPVQVFNQAVLQMPVFEQKLSFRML